MKQISIKTIHKDKLCVLYQFIRTYLGSWDYIKMILKSLGLLNKFVQVSSGMALINMAHVIN